MHEVSQSDEFDTLSVARVRPSPQGGIQPNAVIPDGAPTELGFTRVRQYHHPSRLQPTWMRRSGIPRLFGAHILQIEIPGSMLRIAPE
jgi:hypothetical protein